MHVLVEKDVAETWRRDALRVRFETPPQLLPGRKRPCLPAIEQEKWLLVLRIGGRVVKRADGRRPSGKSRMATAFQLNSMGTGQIKRMRTGASQRIVAKKWGSGDT